MTKQQNNKGEIAKKSETSLSQSEQVNRDFGGDKLEIPKGASLPNISIKRETAQFEQSDGTLVCSLIGHILHYHSVNTYYSTVYGEGDPSPPDCASSDGEWPDGGTNPKSGPCEVCPYNQYPDDGSSKPCTNQYWMYVLLEDEVIPCLLKAPPSSLNKNGSLIRWLTSAPNTAAKAGLGYKYQPLKVRFSLQKKKFKSGMEASVLHLETVRALDLSDTADVVQYKRLVNLYQSLEKNIFGHIRDAVSQNLSVGATSKDDDIDDNDIDDTDIEAEPDSDNNGDNAEPPATENGLFDGDDNDDADDDSDTEDVESDTDVEHQESSTPNPDYVSDNPPEPKDEIPF